MLPVNCLKKRDSGWLTDQLKEILLWRCQMMRRWPLVSYWVLMHVHPAPTSRPISLWGNRAVLGSGTGGCDLTAVSGWGGWNCPPTPKPKQVLRQGRSRRAEMGSEGPGRLAKGCLVGDARGMRGSFLRLCCPAGVSRWLLPSLPSVWPKECSTEIMSSVQPLPLTKWSGFCCNRCCCSALSLYKPRTLSTLYSRSPLFTADVGCQVLAVRAPHCEPYSANDANAADFP